jgi:hypothetical protein
MKSVDFGSEVHCAQWNGLLDLRLLRDSFRRGKKWMEQFLIKDLLLTDHIQTSQDSGGGRDLYAL